MIFVGDLASPDKTFSGIVAKAVSENSGIFSGKTVICNLEGLIYDGEKPSQNEPLLYNNSSILNVFDPNQKSIFCLANNHVLDMPQMFDETASLIRSEENTFCGAGKTKANSHKPVYFSENNHDFALFNACWDFLLYNNNNPKLGIYVAEIIEDQLLKQVKECKEREQDRSIIVYLHWNLDLEKLPFPMHRQFSRELVSAGASLVLGTHSHCVQGGEMFKNGYVIYGLGNFLIPDNEYAGGNLSFPAFAKTELVFEWDTLNDKMVCHWFEYGENNQRVMLDYKGSDEFETSERLRRHSPYLGMNDREYYRFYKSNRRKRLLIPVYRNYKNKKLNKIYTKLLKIRARSAHFLAKINLIKWQN